MWETRISGYIGELNHRVDELSGIPGTLQYIPSPSTAAYIHAELDKRYGPDPVAAMPEDEKKLFLETAYINKHKGPPPTLWQRALSML